MKQINRKSRIQIWAVIMVCALFLTGICTLLYPALMNWIYNRDIQSRKESFERQLQEQKETASGLPFQELYRELKSRNELLFMEHQNNLNDPFSYEQPEINLAEYGLQGNTIGFLSIPEMGIELPILLGANSENLREGAAHLTETSYPVGGENTNCVLAAHRGYGKAAMFRNIEELESGDNIYIENFWGTLTYQVVEIQIISPTDVQKLLIQPGRDLVTLITCHPYRQNYQRYVVYCERVVSEPVQNHSTFR